MHIISCDGCGKLTEASSSRRDLAHAVEGMGWTFIKHLGRHYCPSCQAVNDAGSDTVPVASAYNEARDATRADRDALVIKMRKSGATIADIAKRLCVSNSRAAQILKRAEAVAAQVLVSPSSLATMPDNARHNYPVANLDLTVRSQNALISLGIKTVGQLSTLTLETLEKTPNLGAKSLKEIKEAMLALGIAIPHR